MLQGSRTNGVSDDRSHNLCLSQAFPWLAQMTGVVGYQVGVATLTDMMEVLAMPRHQCQLLKEICCSIMQGASEAASPHSRAATHALVDPDR